MIMMKNIFSIVVLASLLLLSCGEFLEVKPDKKLAVPKKGSDLKALLDYFPGTNQLHPIGIGEIGADNYFVSDADWQSIYYLEHRNLYVWEKTPVIIDYWALAYNKILTANTVIALIDDVTHSSPTERDMILGSALFLRGIVFYHLSQVFSPPFDGTNANEQQDVVLRLSPDINEESQRATIGEMYDQIISDFKTAASLLPPVKPLYPSQPSRAAAYAALSKVYMAMRDYQVAGHYADSCLQLNRELMDFNKIQDVGPYPFDRFNEEVIFYMEMAAYEYLGESRARVDSNLYHSYTEFDNRKRLFFSPANAEGQYLFVGDYSKNSNAIKFCGITTAEILLNQMECLAREGREEELMDYLTYFLSCRYDDPSTVDFGDEERGLLSFILDERRKELIYRGIRWSDIRRLSYDPNHHVEIVRNVNGTRQVLTPDQQKTFHYAIPQEVVDRRGFE